MNVLDLFSGIGGFSLGLERAGFRTQAFCESDEFCRRVLAKHWPGIPIHQDIRELDGSRYRSSIQLVCGGFPCQPYSVAGKQSGSADDRALWPEMYRIIREVQPAFVIGENVPGIVTMELDTVLSDLEREGYECQTFDIPACSLDAHHIRHRIWIIAYASRYAVRQQPGRGIGASGAEAARACDRSSDDPDTDGGRCEISGLTEYGRQLGESWAESDRLRADGRRPGQGEPATWEAESRFCRVPDGVSPRLDRYRTARLRALGNSVVPALVEFIGHAILDSSR